MRRVSVLVTVVAIALAGWLAVARGPLNVGAQAGTPAPGGPPPGLTFETLAFGMAATVPPAPAILVMDRITLAPGASLPGAANDPNLSLFYVEQGTLTARADAPVSVIRGAALTTALATPGTMPAPEEVAAGTAVTLAAGDSAVFPPFVGVEFRNDGTEPVVLLTTTIGPAGGPAAGTPTP